MSPLLAAEEFITFNAGTHCDALRLLWKDYERWLAKPKVVHLSHHEEEVQGAQGRDDSSSCSSTDATARRGRSG